MEWQADKPVLCIAGRGPLDEAAGAMLAQLLEKRGIGARIEGTAALSMSNVVPTDGVAMVCLSYLDTTSPAHMRYMIRPRPAQVARCQDPSRLLAGRWECCVTCGDAKAQCHGLTLRDAVASALQRRKAKMQRVAPSKNGFRWSQPALRSRSAHLLGELCRDLESLPVRQEQSEHICLETRDKECEQTH